MTISILILVALLVSGTLSFPSGGNDGYNEIYSVNTVSVDKKPVTQSVAHITSGGSHTGNDVSGDGLYLSNSNTQVTGGSPSVIQTGDTNMGVSNAAGMGTDTKIDTASNMGVNNIMLHEMTPVVPIVNGVSLEGHSGNFLTVGGMTRIPPTMIHIIRLVPGVSSSSSHQTSSSNESSYKKSSMSMSSTKGSISGVTGPSGLYSGGTGSNNLYLGGTGYNGYYSGGTGSNGYYSGGTGSNGYYSGGTGSNGYYSGKTGSSNLPSGVSGSNGLYIGATGSGDVSSGLTGLSSEVVDNSGGLYEIIGASKIIPSGTFNVGTLTMVQPPLYVVGTGPGQLEPITSENKFMEMKSSSSSSESSKKVSSVTSVAK